MPTLAKENNEQLKIYVVIPSVPGMEGDLENNEAVPQEILIHLTLNSICRGKSSIKETLKRNGFKEDEWKKYIFFASFRKTENNPENGQPCQEVGKVTNMLQIYQVVIINDQIQYL